jgi:uncharacterized membrane protein YfcA
MMHEITLFLLGLTTGFIGTNTGGSALVTVPILVSLGIPPQSAVATARVATVGTMVAGLSQFHKAGKVDYRLALPACFFAVIGSLTGAQLLLLLPHAVLQQSIGILTLAFTLLSFLKKAQNFEKPPDVGIRTIGYALFFFTGLVGGFFGGQAILATYIFVLIFNKTLSESVGTRKVTGLAVALPSLFFYGVHGIIEWQWACCLVGGTLIGSFFGSQYALKKGDAWLKYLFTVVSVALSVKLIFF